MMRLPNLFAPRAALLRAQWAKNFRARGNSA